MVKKLACFFSGGYTEAAGYMQLFLGRINDEYDYIQCLPNSTRKRKGDLRKLEDDINGITGDNLLEKVYEKLEKSYIKNEITKGAFEGVLIEDDLDGRFEGKNWEEINDFEGKIRKKIEMILGKKVPVYFIYAAPEIESWFISDWENGFGYFFNNTLKLPKGFTESDRKTFAIHLKADIKKKLLKNGKIAIEEYAHSQGKYRKLSKDLEYLIEKRNGEEINNKERKEDFDFGKGFYYSKRIHGPFILKYINPDKVKEKCDYYFLKSYLELKNGIGKKSNA